MLNSYKSDLLFTFSIVSKVVLVQCTGSFEMTTVFYRIRFSTLNEKEIQGHVSGNAWFSTFHLGAILFLSQNNAPQITIIILSSIVAYNGFTNFDTIFSQIGFQTAEISMLKDVKTWPFSYFLQILASKPQPFHNRCRKRYS